MTFEISANSLIDTLVNLTYEIEEGYKRIPKGTYIYQGSEYEPIYRAMNEAQQRFYFANDLTGFSLSVLYGVAYTARRWYERTEWKKCLPESDAERLLACMVRQCNPDSQYDSKERGNDYLLFMHGVISKWAIRSMEQKTAS